MTFEEEPRDEATHVNPSAFTPKLFTSSAAATSKVRPSQRFLPPPRH